MLCTNTTYAETEMNINSLFDWGVVEAQESTGHHLDHNHTQPHLPHAPHLTKLLAVCTMRGQLCTRVQTNTTCLEELSMSSVRPTKCGHTRPQPKKRPFHC